MSSSVHLSTPPNQLTLLQTSNLGEQKGVTWLGQTISTIRTMSQMVNQTGCFDQLAQRDDLGNLIPVIPEVTEAAASAALLYSLPNRGRDRESIQYRVHEWCTDANHANQYGAQVPGSFQRILDKALEYERDARGPSGGSLRATFQDPPPTANEEDPNPQAEPPTQGGTVAAMARQNRVVMQPGAPGEDTGPTTRAPAPTRSQRPRNCWNCQKPGHFARDCPEPTNPQRLRAVTEQDLDQWLPFDAGPAETAQFGQRLAALMQSTREERETEE
jgi:hypothetical protein